MTLRDIIEVIENLAPYAALAGFSFLGGLYFRDLFNVKPEEWASYPVSSREDAVEKLRAAYSKIGNTNIILGFDSDGEVLEREGEKEIENGNIRFVGHYNCSVLQVDVSEGEGMRLHEALKQYAEALN